MSRTILKFFNYFITTERLTKSTSVDPFTLRYTIQFWAKMSAYHANIFSINKNKKQKDLLL